MGLGGTDTIRRKLRDLLGSVDYFIVQNSISRVCMVKKKNSVQKTVGKHAVLFKNKSEVR